MKIFIENSKNLINDKKNFQKYQNKKDFNENFIRKMKSKSQTILTKKINFIERNKRKVSSILSKNPKSASTALQSISLNIPSSPQPIKKLIPKSQMPGFSFRLSFPELSTELFDSYLSNPIDEYKLFTKCSYSDTDCPPSPPDYSLFDIQEKISEYNMTPSILNHDTSTQTDFKQKKTQQFSLRKSERLANKKNLKSKINQTCYVSKRIKFN